MTEAFVPPSYSSAADATWRCADLCDAMRDVIGAALRVLPPRLASLGGRSWYFGEAVIAQSTQADGAMSLADLLQTSGHGRVLVVDGRGNAQHAILGDRMAALAVQHGWSGIVLWGYARDLRELSRMPLGVHALGARPNRPVQMTPAHLGRSIEMDDVTVREGDWIYADEDGVIALGARHTTLMQEARPASA